MIEETEEVLENKEVIEEKEEEIQGKEDQKRTSQTKINEKKR